MSIPSAEEIMQKHLDPHDCLRVSKCYDMTLDAMKEFAKLHVEAALKEAINNARIIDDPNSYCGNTGSEYPPDQILDMDAILNSYPLENIK